MTTSEIERSLTTVFARSLREPFMRAIREHRLISAGDHIAVCISGGKDSLLLGCLMRGLTREMDIELTFLSMDPGYTPAHRAHIEANAAALGLPLTVFETNVLRVAGNHSAEHPCFLCAKMRRGHLYAQAQALGCNKIALGHHFDDAIETVLLGLIYGGQIQAMLPRLPSKSYPGMELIRPMYLVRERAVIEWMDYCGLTAQPCGCPAAQREQPTKRAEIKALIAALAKENPQIEANILNAVKNVNVKNLLGWRDLGGARHSYFEQFSCGDPKDTAQ